MLERTPSAGLTESTPEPAHTLVDEPVGPRCLNCASVLVGEFCARCGQSANTRLLSVRQIISDMLGGLFNYDSKLWATLTPLVTRPGHLTNAYLLGQRVRYIPPFQLYFWINAVCFLVYSYTFSQSAKRLSDANSKTLLCVTILIALLVAALQWRQRRLFVTHLVFSLHVHAFATLVLMVSTACIFAASLFLSVPADLVITIVFSVCLPVYYFVALRAVYRQSVLVTLSKVALVLMVYAVCMPRIQQFLIHRYNRQTPRVATTASTPVTGEP